VGIGKDQLIVNGDEGSLDSSLGKPHNLPNDNHKGEQHLNHNSPQLLRQDDVSSPDYGKHKKGYTQENKKQDRPETYGQNKGGRRMNPGKADIGHYPQQHHEARENQTGEKEKPYKYSLLGVGVFHECLNLGAAVRAQ
jgi:hypothetical protein